VAGIDTPAGYTRLERTEPGAEADVYRAWDERAGRWAVLKLFHRFARGRTEEAAFAAHVAASVGLGRDASIVPVRAGGITATGRPWLALDLVDGRVLTDVLRDDPPSAAGALRLVVTLADALAWAHSMRPPMVHGRIRAEHIRIDVTGMPMVADFAAPRGPMPAPTPRGDVTGLAAVLFLALTGNPWPGRGEPDDRIIADWPGLDRLFDEVLTPAPAIDTMADFAARLRRILGPDALPAADGETTPAAPEIDDQEPIGYGGKRRLPELALAAWGRLRFPVGRSGRR
jgi:hypothetical protein